MRLDLEPQDIEAIARRTAELLLPKLQAKQAVPVEEPFLTVKTLAARLGVSIDWVYKNAETGTLPYFKCGRHLRFRKSEIEKWMEGNSVRP